jgi:uncharacterized membrane protein
MVLNLAFWLAVIPALLKMIKKAEEAFGPATGEQKKNSVMDIFKTFFDAVPDIFPNATLPAWDKIDGVISDIIDVFVGLLNFFGIFKKALPNSGRVRTFLLAVMGTVLALALFIAPAFAVDLSGQTWTSDDYPGWRIFTTDCLFPPCITQDTGGVRAVDPMGKPYNLGNWGTAQISQLLVAGYPAKLSDDGQTLTIYLGAGNSLVLKRSD